jgi:hypothetical protein
MQDERKTASFLFADSHEQHGRPRPDRQSIARSATTCVPSGIARLVSPLNAKNASGPEWMWTGAVMPGLNTDRR